MSHNITKALPGLGVAPGLLAGRPGPQPPPSHCLPTPPVEPLARHCRPTRRAPPAREAARAGRGDGRGGEWPLRRGRR